jgi:phosphatidylethanolamine-binding protein (PEBP) family uncharacterized protein
MKKNIFILPAFMFFISCQKTNNATNNTSGSNLVTSPIIANQIKFNGNGFAHNGLYPKLYTCDSIGVSPGLQWSNAPSTSTNYAITMYTIPPTGEKHVYIVLYNIPATATSIPDNSKSIGIFGINTVNGKTTYTPPCSQGAGAKIYVLTLYALNALPTFSVPSSQVTMAILQASMKNKIVDSAVMSVTYTRP